MKKNIYFISVKFDGKWEARLVSGYTFDWRWPGKKDICLSFGVVKDPFDEWVVSELSTGRRVFKVPRKKDVMPYLEANGWRLAPAIHGAITSGDKSITFCKNLIAQAYAEL